MYEDPENPSSEEGETSGEDESGSTDETESGESEEPSGEEPSGEEQSGEEPTDAESEQALMARVDSAEAQSLAAAIAAYHGISSGFGADSLDTTASDAQEMAGEPIRAECGPKGCDFAVTSDDGEVFALVGCGDGTCPTCPPGLGNLIVRHWCAYVGVTSQRSAIVLILVFGGKWGPFLV